MSNGIWRGMLLLGGGLLASGAARAQYAAPGFPLLPVRRPLPAPSPDPAANELLPRFWRDANPARQAAGRTRFFEAVMAKAQYPAGAQPPPTRPNAPLPTGRLFVVLHVRADGTVRQPPRISRRELEQPTSAYDPAAIRALDAEAQRVLGALRFARARTALDSLVVPMRFQTREPGAAPAR